MLAVLYIDFKIMFKQYATLAQKVNINNKKVYIFCDKEKKICGGKKAKNNAIAIIIILILSIFANNFKFKLIFLKRLTYKKR